MFTFKVMYTIILCMHVLLLIYLLIDTCIPFQLQICDLVIIFFVVFDTKATGIANSLL